MTRVERIEGADGVVKFLLSRGYVWDREQLAIWWSSRLGYEHIGLVFNPHDKGWDAIITHHASGTNPRLCIGLCDSVDDVDRTHTAIRLINGYRHPDEERYVV